MPWNTTPAQSKQKMPHPTSHRAEHQRSKGYTSKCFGVFDFQLISKFCTARNIFMSPESSSSQFFLKAVSFSCCLQLLTPIKCSWMCRKSKGTAAVGVKVNLYTAKLEHLLNSDWQAYQLEWTGLPQQCCQAEAAHSESTRVFAVPKCISVVEVRGQLSNWRNVGQAAGTSGGGEACPSPLLLPSSPNKSVPTLSFWCSPWWWGAGYWLTEALLARHVKNLWKCQEKHEWCSMFAFVICLHLSGVSREEQGVSVWGLDQLFLGKNAAYTGSTYTWYV